MQSETRGALFQVPLTLEGAFVLHQMMRVAWPAWRGSSSETRRAALEEAQALLEPPERGGESALFSLLGHKGDLLILHFRRSLEELKQAELGIRRLKLGEFLQAVSSYVSVIELGLYEASVRLYERLRAENVAPGSAAWKEAVEKELEQQRQMAAPRLWPKIPARRYVCFYPMSKLRGEEKNWYQLPVQARQRLMQEHGAIGRRYAGQVTQIISGSIGFDDWEWGVDLFADDPLVFKKLVYEMRFDEASALYGLFGQFYVGLQFPARELGRLLSGELPPWSPAERERR
ncbi:MAG TPA: hydrogen peroxide-dependent heme synthase [Candidatus Acidoferrales bacterium]|nr:hydrogen peroxide-dependent heme synthase [Candidatus Acidoferrales bacterium]